MPSVTSVGEGGKEKIKHANNSLRVNMISL